MKATNLKPFFAALATALLAGCISAPLQNTPSGRNEITIAASKARVKEALVTELVDFHFMPVQDTDYMLVADGDASAGAKFWFTTVGGREPQTRMRFTLIEMDGKTRIVGAPYLLIPYMSNWNEQPFTDPQAYANLQWLLECVAADVNGHPHSAQPAKIKVVMPDVRPPSQK